MTIAIRRRTPADLAASVAALYRSHQHDRYPLVWPADPAGWLTPHGVESAWVAGSGGEVLGHVALVEGPGPAVSVARLFVRPDGQGQGVAGRLMAAVAARAAALGRPLELDVIEDSAAAIRLYRRLGWRLAEQGPADFTRPDGTRPTLFRFLAPEPS